MLSEKDASVQNLIDSIERCGSTGEAILAQKAAGDAKAVDGAQYVQALLELLDIMKAVSRDTITAAGYPSNIESTILMDKYLIEGTLTEEFDQLSLLSTLVTYVACNREGRPGHSAEYMDRVTALRKVIEEVYGTEAMRFCGRDGC